MGFSNGNLTSEADKGGKGVKGDKGVGFSLTADNHFHIRSKRLTNMSLPKKANNKYVMMLFQVLLEIIILKQK